MATRNNTFILKRSNVVDKIPALSGLTLGELALNTADAKLYTLYTGGLTGATEVREIGWNRLSISGGTLYGGLNVLGAVTATTFYGDGSNLTGLATTDNFVTGGTFSNNTLTLNRQNGSVTITGFTDFYITGGTFSGGTLTLNQQNGSIIITGFTSGGGTGVDTYATGFTYSNNNLTISQNQGQTPLVVNISTMTGLTVNGILSANTLNTPIPNTQVVYSNNGTLTGSTNLTWVNSASTLTVNGTLEAISKSFSIPHPTKEGKKLIYGSLEGPENGVYHRGILKNKNTIILPEYWYKLVDKDTVTVQLTPIGKYQKLYVKEVYDNSIVIGIDNGIFQNNKINCFFIVYGERKDINKLEVEK